jgi:hypothetical protein
MNIIDHEQHRSVCRHRREHPVQGVERRALLHVQRPIPRQQCRHDRRPGQPSITVLRGRTTQLRLQQLTRHPQREVAFQIDTAGRQNTNVAHTRAHLVKHRRFSHPRRSLNENRAALGCYGAVNKPVDQGQYLVAFKQANHHRCTLPRSLSQTIEFQGETIPAVTFDGRSLVGTRNGASARR